MFILTWKTPGLRGAELNGFAGKDSGPFWSTGVLECWKKLNPDFQLE
jgi:hypothetical protein